MRKILIISLTLLLLPFLSFAADELNFDADTTIDVNGVDLIILSGSIVDQMVVNESSIVFSLSGNSKITITSNDKKILNNSLTDYICASSYSQVRVVGNSLGSSLSVSPSSEVCISATGGNTPTITPLPGGGGSVTPSKPTTTTGEVTATASGGGKTTLTTSSGTITSVDLPANAVNTLTSVKVKAIEKSTIVESQPVPSNRNIVGDFVYDYTAIANSENISSFDKDITLTFTYVNDQITDLDESTLKVFYWKETTSQWVALTTTVNTENNTLTATTNHFTHFTIMGLTEEITEGDSIIFDGNLIRNPNAEDMAQFDIYIVKIVNGKNFRRLILSPHVFESYEHFDKNGNGSPWDDVKDISSSSMSQYAISDLVRATDDDKVYKLSTEEGSDTGIKQWLNMTSENFLNQYDVDSIYEINAVDRNAYVLGSDI